MRFLTPWRSSIPQKRAQTAGPGWYGLPAFPGADNKSGSVGASTSASSRYASNPRGRTAEEMRREVQAIRLRNALDPKRFYKGGGKVEKGMPKYAQVSRSRVEPSNPLGWHRAQLIVHSYLRCVCAFRFRSAPPLSSEGS